MSRKAIFLDRDGVINVERSFILSPGDMDLYPFSAEAIRKINQSEYLAIVITNQSAVARNYITLEQLDEIHQELRKQLKEHGAYLDAIYFCPHKEKLEIDVPDKTYISDCECRKPKPGMLLQASKDFGISLMESYLIGDSERDIIAGKRAECTTIGVKTGYGLKGLKESPDYVFADLQQAVDFIIQQHGD